MKYIKSVFAELKRVTWISKTSLIKNSITVIFVTILLTSYIYGVDSLSDMLSKLIIGKL